MSMIAKTISRLIPFIIVLLLAVYFIINISVFWPKIINLVGSATDESASVIHIVDGDTVLVLNNDEIQEIRVIGFDAPELALNGRPSQCYATRSIEKLNEYFSENRNVILTSDESVGDIDQYGRKLRYISSANNTDIALDMIRGGFGHEMTIQPYARQKTYQQAQKEAEDEHKGIWGQSCAQ